MWARSSITKAYAIGCPIDQAPALFAWIEERHPRRRMNPRRHRGTPAATRLKITADSACLEAIDYMRKLGFDIASAIKGKGSLEDGIIFLKSSDIVDHPGCSHLVDELVHYGWAIDRQTGEVLPRLAGSHKHVIDAPRYALKGARRASSYEPIIVSLARARQLTCEAMISIRRTEASEARPNAPGQRSSRFSSK